MNCSQLSEHSTINPVLDLQTLVCFSAIVCNSFKCMISLCRGVFGSHCSLAGEEEDAGIAVVMCNGSARTKTELLAWVHLSSQHQRCCK